MKLKEPPKNTVVHTPTKEDAKELLAILYENGYKWNMGDSLIDHTHWCGSNCAYHIYPDENVVTWNHVISNGSITIAEFKERYCEEEKPQPKFEIGDKVRILKNCGCNVKGVIGTVEHIGERGLYVETAICRLFVTFDEIEPYTEPETKPTEDMGTKENRNLSQDIANCDKPENKELNLCELLKGHEGEIFFSPFYGAMVLMSISDGLLCFQNSNIGIDLLPNGQSQYAVDGYCAIFPSKALYEQYPLDPYTAWMKWQEGQKKYILAIVYNCPDKDNAESIKHLSFCTSSDRDKCIGEIKAIIGKYIKK